MTQEHSITPPSELVQQWITEGHHQDYCNTTVYCIAKAARWGADQELEGCVKWLKGEAMTKMWNTVAELASELHASRRPKPPSLKEQALSALYAITSGADDTREFYQDIETVKKALESLPD